MRAKIFLALAASTILTHHANAELGNTTDAVGILSQDDDTALQRLTAIESAETSAGVEGDEWIWEDAQGPGGCAACEVMLSQLKVAAAGGDAFFVRFVTQLCIKSGVQDPDVCEGAIALEGPIIARGIRGIELGSRVSKLFCVNSLGLCSYPEVEPWDVPLRSPKPAMSRPSPSGQKPLHIVHYSDIHIDPFYQEGANTNCTKPICCRDYSSNDVANGYHIPAGPHGDHRCDSPASLEDSMYEAIQRLVPDVAFGIFTGDIVDHAIWNTTTDQNTIDIQDAYVRMANAGLRVYSTAGNHESSPTNSYPPLGVSDSAQWLYNLLSLSWVRWIGTGAAQTAKAIGAYSTKYEHGNLRIISLNTNLQYSHNYWLYEDPMQKDPSGQLTWLTGELDAAERDGERVYIIGHMPMGSLDAFHDGSNYFDQIVNRYSATIAGLFFGHTHLDEFELAYANYSARSYSNALVTTYITPSMTPTSGHPSFRVYTVDPVTFGVLDATTYIADMSNSDFQTKGPTWKKYYSAKEAYGPLVSPPLEAPEVELTPAFWHNVTEVLEKNATAFEEFFTRKRRGWLADEVLCNEDCVKLEICKMRAARSQDNCLRPAARLSVGRNAGNGHADTAEGDDCDGSIIKRTLASIDVQRTLLLMRPEEAKKLRLSHQDGGVDTDIMSEL